MSAPATNAFSPAPVRMMPFTAASESSAPNAWSSSRIVCAFSAFSLVGRFRVTTAMPPSRVSTSRFWKVMALLLQAGGGPDRFRCVVVEPLAGLLAVHARLHHALQQRRRREPLLAELVEHDVGDVVRGVEAH